MQQLSDICWDCCLCIAGSPWGCFVVKRFDDTHVPPQYCEAHLNLLQCKTRSAAQSLAVIFVSTLGLACLHVCRDNELFEKAANVEDTFRVGLA